MKPDPKYLNLPKSFWAYVRCISEKCQYTKRSSQTVSSPGLDEILAAVHVLKLDVSEVLRPGGDLTPLGQQLLDYFKFRADVLNTKARHHLMDAKKAKALYEFVRAEHKQVKIKAPWNKQKGKKKAPAYLSAIVAILVRANAADFPCDLDPRALTTITRQGKALRTLARRLDGAFPSTANPIAVWEIKEYYYTTTFGSRVANGVYESLLDGMELEELREHEGVKVKHYLIIDAHYTWWSCGKSYLCRIIDMLHMGYVDEVIFGDEVVERLPDLVKEWVAAARDSAP